MKRLNKLYEATALVKQARSILNSQIQGLQFNSAVRKELWPLMNESLIQLDALRARIELLIERETERELSVHEGGVK